MIRARRRFLDRGHYAPLRDELLRVIEGQAILDVGCGEGYYTRPLSGATGPSWIGAIDISKVAVRLAARRSDRIAYAVANAFDLPVPTSSIDVVLSVFGPVARDEFARVLRGGGRMVVVSPGPAHLAELKTLLFDAPEQHPGGGPLDEDARFLVTDRSSVSYRLDIGPPDLSDLVEMTPYRWTAPHEGRARVAGIAALSVAVDFLVSEYRAA